MGGSKRYQELKNNKKIEAIKKFSQVVERLISFLENKG
jgi:hypothetical protein